MDSPTDSRIIYEDDYLTIRDYKGTEVVVSFGRYRETATTVVDATDLVTSLNAFLRSEDSDG